MSRTIHTKGQNNWQPRHMTQWQREKRDGRIQPMHRPSSFERWFRSLWK